MFVADYITDSRHDFMKIGEIGCCGACDGFFSLNFPQIHEQNQNKSSIFAAVMFYNCFTKI